MKSMTKKLVELVVIMSVFAILAIGSGSNDSGTVSNEDSNTTTSDSSGDSTDDSSSEAEDDDSSKKSSNDVVKVGGSFEKDGLKFTFKKANTNYKPSDDKYGMYKPSKGRKFVACTFKFENSGDSDEYVSIYDFDCYADNESCEQQFISTEDFKNGDFMNENLSSGRNVTFTTFYEVPKKAKSIQLEYEPSFWSDEKVIIQVK